MNNPSNTSTFSVEVINKSPINLQELKPANNSVSQDLTQSPSKKKNECEICKKSFSTSGNMRNHYLTIHQNYRPYMCEYPGCSKKYSILSRYQVHMRTHQGKKPFLCQICNKSFNEKGNLKTHLRFHSELRPFKCPKCTKCYKTNGHLKDHIEIQHNKIKKYKCEKCNKNFGRISTLKAHIRTHTGEKNFKCKMEGCDKYFAEKGNMEIHYKRHLKKLNLLDVDENTNKKNYGQKNIEIGFEKRIQDAIDSLKDLNSNIDEESNTIGNKNNHFKQPKSNNKLFCSNTNIQTIFQEKINKNINSINQPNNPIINNEIELFSKLIGSEQEKNIFRQNSQNILNIDKEIQHYSSHMNFALPQEQPTEHFQQLNKSEQKLDEYGGITRPGSNTTLCPEQRPDDIFAKPDDLESIGEDKNLNQNIFVNENYNINMPFNYCNYVFFGNLAQPYLLNDNKMLNFNLD